MTKRVKIIIGSVAGGVVLFGGIAYKNNTRDYISDFAIAGMGSSSSAVDVQPEIERVQSDREPAESDAAQSTSVEQSESSIDLNPASTPEQSSIDVNSSTSSVSNTSSVSKQSSASVNSATTSVEQSESKPAESSSKSQSSKSKSSSVDRSPSVESAPSTPAESSKPAPQSSEGASAPSVSNNEQSDYYVLNTNSKKVHLPTCGSVKTIKSENYAETTDLASAISQGYTACKRCKPF